MNFFKDEIAQLGGELQATVKQASGELNVIVQQAGEGLQAVVRQAGEEIGKQRTLTKADMQELIQFAVGELNTSIDQRLDTAKRELSATLRSAAIVFTVMGIAFAVMAGVLIKL
jgi:hypothetical protein